MAWRRTRRSGALLFRSDREFQVWDYNVSHRQLLIRSPRSDDRETNIDIVFWGVRSLEAPTSFDGMSISMRQAEGESDAIAFAIESAGGAGVVVAEVCQVRENELDIFDSSLTCAQRDRPAEEYGVVLAESKRRQ